jgi:hypothetical protein
MQKWLNDLYTQILKNGYNPGGGGGGGGSHSGDGQGVLVGKYLGDTYTDTQKQAIANGTFEGLNIGDYWTINDVNYRIADFDYYYNVGDTAFTKHHVIIVPDTALRDGAMSTSPVSTSGGYVGKRGRELMTSYDLPKFVNAFGDSFIATHRGLYANTVTDGVPSNNSWVNMRVELMTEEQLYGHAVWGACNQNGYDVGTQKTQFRLFALDQTKINIRHKYWLTNVKSSNQFACLDENGSPSFAKPDSTIGFRPFACLVGDTD